MGVKLRPYANNLLKGDRIWDAKRLREGVVAAQPREMSVKVAVIYAGTNSMRYVHVGDLRFWPPGDGEPEDVPPIDGELPCSW